MYDYLILIKKNDATCYLEPIETIWITLILWVLGTYMYLCLLKQWQALSLSNANAPAIPPWSFALGLWSDYRETSRNAVRTRCNFSNFTVRNTFCNIINHHHIIQHHNPSTLSRRFFWHLGRHPPNPPHWLGMSKWHWIETQHRQRHNAHGASHPIAIDLAGDHWSHWIRLGILVRWRPLNIDIDCKHLGMVISGIRQGKRRMLAMLFMDNSSG